MTTFLISQLCASYRGESDFFANFQSLACRLDGVENVLVLAAGERPGTQRAGKVFASAPVRYLDEEIGELHMFFDVARFQNSSPLPLVKFLAKHLGIAIQSAAVRASHKALQDDLEELQDEVHEDKLLERARGVIESCRLIPPGHGRRLLKKVSDQSGKTVRDVARGIVTSATRNPWKYRRQFWA